jgi:hypothetical protein
MVNSGAAAACVHWRVEYAVSSWVNPKGNSLNETISCLPDDVFGMATLAGREREEGDKNSRRCLQWSWFGKEGKRG